LGGTYKIRKIINEVNKNILCIFRYVFIRKKARRKIFQEEEARTFCAMRIKIRIRAIFRLISDKIKTRSLLRIQAATISLAGNTKAIAYNKATDKLLNFFNCLIEINESRKVALQFVKDIKRIQKRWKGMLRLNNTRKMLLRRKWDKMVENLIKQNQAKGKKQQPLVRKLQALSENLVTKSLSSWYSTAKRKYYTLLSKWYAKKQAIEVFF